MTLGARRDTRIDAFLVRWLALGLSVFVALMAGRFASWYAGEMPSLLQAYLAYAWVGVAINVLVMVVQAIIKGKPTGAGSSATIWRSINAMLATASFLTVVSGIGAMVMVGLHLKPL